MLIISGISIAFIGCAVFLISALGAPGWLMAASIITGCSAGYGGYIWVLESGRFY